MDVCLCVCVRMCARAFVCVSAYACTDVSRKVAEKGITPTTQRYAQTFSAFRAISFQLQPGHVRYA